MFSTIMIFLGGYLLIPVITVLGGLDDNISRMQGWAKKNPHHFWFGFVNGDARSTDDTVGMNFFSWVGGVAWSVSTMIVALFATYGDTAKYLHNPAWLVSYLAGLGLFGAVSLTNNLVDGDWSKVWPAIKSYTKAAALAIGHKLKLWWPGIRKFFFVHTNDQDKTDLATAKQHVRDIEKLFVLKKEKKLLKPLLIRVYRIVNKELPHLIKMRAAIRIRSAEALVTINRQQENGIIEGEGTMMEKSRAAYNQLVENEKNLQHKIELIKTLLDHLSTQVSGALEEIDRGGELLVYDLINSMDRQIDGVVIDTPELRELEQAVSKIELKAPAAKTSQPPQAVKIA